jgi:uncharacterized protein with gpF-like domain
VSGHNFAAIEGYKQSGVVQKKEWLSSKDDKVRDSHAMVDGEQVLIDQPFSNGMMFPGDPAAPPEMSINDRCTVLPVVEN